MGQPYDGEKWELYDLTKDRSECNDLAASMPEKLEEMIGLWWEEAERNGVLPLDDRGVQLFGARFRRNSPHPEDRRYVYRPPMSPMPGQASAGLGGRNVHLVATVDYRPGDQGVLYKNGNRNSGFSMFVQDGRFVVDYNAFGDHTVLESPVPVPTGVVRLGVRLARGDNRTGTVSLEFDGVQVATAALPLYMTMMSSVGPSIGFDHGVTVSERYASPFAYTGDLREVVIEAGQRSKAAAEAEARTEMGRQ